MSERSEHSEGGGGAVAKRAAGARPPVTRRPPSAIVAGQRAALVAEARAVADHEARAALQDLVHLREVGPDDAEQHEQQANITDITVISDAQPGTTCPRRYVTMM